MDGDPSENGAWDLGVGYGDDGFVLMKKPNRDEKLEVRLTHEEKARLKETAARLGLTLSEWARRRLLDESGMLGQSLLD